MQGLTGVDDPYEPPERPKIAIDTAGIDPDTATLRVMAVLERSGHVRAPAQCGAAPGEREADR